MKTPSPVVALRSKRGYSATKCDASMAKAQKILRRQFGHSYDQKKVRNNLLTPVVAVNCSDWPRAFPPVLLVVLVFILVFFLVLCCSSCPSPSQERPPAGAASGRVPAEGRHARPPGGKRSVAAMDGAKRRGKKHLNNGTTRLGQRQRHQRTLAPHHRAARELTSGSLGSLRRRE